MFHVLSNSVVDRTANVYGSRVPQQIKEGKNAVLAALAPQHKLVKGVEFLENFNLSPAETAISGGSPRYTGVVVSLLPDYKLSAADSVWFNGPYSETLSMYRVEKGKFKQVDAEMMKEDDNQALCGIYVKNDQDEFTGTVTTQKYCIVNASAGDMSRDKFQEWTSGNLTVKDAYEKALTEELAVVDGQQDEMHEYDNMKHYISHVTSLMAGEMGACGKEEYCQVTNTFAKGAHNVVHFLNGAVAPASCKGSLCHVSPLHGFIRLPRSESRNFYPATLLSSDKYVDVSQLNEQQRNHVFTRAMWPANNTTTVNPFALRRPIDNWKSALPQPTEVIRMEQSNFSLNDAEKRALAPAAVLSMTPTSEHSVSGIEFPTHVKNDRVEMHPHEHLIQQLVSMRMTHDILNPELFRKTLDQNGALVSTHLSLPRDLAEKLQ